MGWYLTGRYKGDYLSDSDDASIKTSLEELAQVAHNRAGGCDLFLLDGTVQGSAAKDLWRRITGLQEDGLFIDGDQLGECWKLIENYDTSLITAKNELIAYWSLRELVGFCVDLGCIIQVNV